MDAIPFEAWVALLFLVPVFGIAWLVVARLREHRCPTCGGPMSRADDPSQLGPGAKQEMEMGSVDHRVYRCRRCRAIHVVSEALIARLVGKGEG